MAHRVQNHEDLQHTGKKYIEYLQRIKQEKELYKMKAQVAKALAHESRLMIVDALYERDMCVSELTELVGADQSTVSKHLSVLKNAGIVIDHKERSNKVYYRLKVPSIQNFSLWAMRIIRENIPAPSFHAARQALAERENMKE
ncbi:MAG: metalloregulator ArsR/SmtB family transcription factor [Desulfobacteraceae bacterium]|jgi:ArsR family transcriptional regulator